MSDGTMWMAAALYCTVLLLLILLLYVDVHRVSYW